MIDELKADITVVIEELASAFADAENGEAHIVSKVGSRFHKRVERLMKALMDGDLGVDMTEIA